MRDEERIFLVLGTRINSLNHNRNSHIFFEEGIFNIYYLRPENKITPNKDGKFSSIFEPLL